MAFALLDKLQESRAISLSFNPPVLLSPFPPSPSFSSASTNSSVLTEIELFRLEQRYARRKGRDGFVSEAQYVDGEYVYGYLGKSGVKGSARDVTLEVERRVEKVGRKGS